MMKPFRAIALRDAFHRGFIAPADMQRRTEARNHVHAGLTFQLAAERTRPSPVTTQVERFALAMISGIVPEASSRPLAI